MTDGVEQRPGPRHAAPRRAGRLRGRAFALAAVPTALLMGAIPTLAQAEPKTCGAATAPDTILEEIPVPKSELTPLPGPGLPGTVPSATPSAPAGEPSASAPSTSAPSTPSASPTAASLTGAGRTVSNAVALGSGPARVSPAGLIDDLVGVFVPPKPGASATPAQPPKPALVTPTPAATPGEPTPAAPSSPAAPKPRTAESPSAAPTGAAPQSPSAAQPSAKAGTGEAAKPSASPSAKAEQGKPSGKPTPVPGSSGDPNCQLDTRSMKAAAAGPGHVVPEQNWTLRSTLLALHGSVFNGVYDVRTPTTTKRVLKFTTASVDIENLDMSTIQVPGYTFHVKGGPGTTSTMRQGPVTMYVESLSGHLTEVIGLPIPIDLGEITLTPDTLPRWLWDMLSTVPIPLDLKLKDAKAVQAGQFGGTLKIPGMRLYNDQTPY
ncbi:hypothetical protein ACIRBX_21895 [Kitasatospora sp. NPDC096147]|uniref:hypothetical protein n=1 Tax=Kitasatospora sp. NPDC096147 TaxID=3364093 RepID=UPI0037F32D69